MEQPDKIGKYEVRSRLGQGATSTVWLAWEKLCPFRSPWNLL